VTARPGDAVLFYKLRHKSDGTRPECVDEVLLPPPSSLARSLARRPSPRELRLCCGAGGTAVTGIGLQIFLSSDVVPLIRLAAAYIKSTRHHSASPNAERR
jgi:hypothetical protein